VIDILVSNFAFKFNLYRYNVDENNTAFDRIASTFPLVGLYQSNPVDP
jgi:hypothetical protein